MSAAVRNRSPMRHPSDSPRRRRSPPRRDRSPDHRRTSSRAKSPIRNSTSHRSRSPVDVGHAKAARRRQSRSPIRERPSQRTRSPVRAQSRSPARTDSSRSPSPRTKRLRRAQANRDDGKQLGSDHTRERDTMSAFTRDKIDGRPPKPARHGPSVSPSERDRQHRRRSSGSPPRASRDRAREEVNNSRGAERSRDYGDDSVSKMKAAEEALEAKQKQKPSFELSGKLAEETNRVRGVALLFTEPPDARKPDVRWRLYVFKAGEVLNEPLYLHRQSSYLFGRERRVADVPTDHPSCSKQHAVIQYRLVEKEQPDGLMKKQVRPYLMDLGSTNGTFINDNRIEAQRYYELFEKDTIKFGNSSREYVCCMKTPFSKRPCCCCHLVVGAEHQKDLPSRRGVHSTLIKFCFFVVYLFCTFFMTKQNATRAHSHLLLLFEWLVQLIVIMS